MLWLFREKIIDSASEVGKLLDEVLVDVGPHAVPDFWMVFHQNCPGIGVSEGKLVTMPNPCGIESFLRMTV